MPLIMSASPAAQHPLDTGERYPDQALPGALSFVLSSVADV
jgi:hypothetical protein